MPLTLDPSLSDEARQAAVAIARVLEKLERDVTPRANISFDHFDVDLAELRYRELYDATCRLDLRGCPEDFHQHMQDFVAVLDSIQSLVAEAVAIQRRYGGWRGGIERFRNRVFGPGRSARRVDLALAEVRIHIDAMCQVLTELERCAVRHGVTDMPT